MAFGRPGDAPEVIFEKGKGVILTDVNGKEYMDLCSFFHCTSLGYGREDIAEVAFEEMKNSALPLTLASITIRPASNMRRHSLLFLPRTSITSSSVIREVKLMR